MVSGFNMNTHSRGGGEMLILVFSGKMAPSIILSQFLLFGDMLVPAGACALYRSAR